MFAPQRRCQNLLMLDSVPHCCLFLALYHRYLHTRTRHRLHFMSLPAHSHIVSLDLSLYHQYQPGPCHGEQVGLQFVVFLMGPILELRSFYLRRSTWIPNTRLQRMTVGLTTASLEQAWQSSGYLKSGIATLGHVADYLTCAVAIHA